MVVKTTRLPARRPAGRKPVPVSTTGKAKTTAAKKPAAKKSLPKKISPQKISSTARRVTPKALDAISEERDEVAREAIAFRQQKAAKPAVNHKRSAVERLDDPPPAPLPTLLTRVSRAIERELTQIEIIVGGVRVNPSQRTEAERRARTLASLARTLREVMHLRAGEEKAREDDDALPRDIDELRRQLARRLDQLVAEAKAAHPGEVE